jgi:integrase
MATSNLTVTAIAASKCPPEQRVHYMYDAGCPGLYLRVWPNGAKSWTLDYSMDGRRYRKVLGAYGTTPEEGLTLKQARERAQRLQLQVRDGLNPARIAEEKKTALTFQDIVERWQSEYAEENRTARTRGDDASMLKNYILPHLGGIRGIALTTDDINVMVSATVKATDGRAGTKKDKSPKRVVAQRMSTRPNRVFELTRAVVRWAYRNKLIPTNPMEMLTRPKKKERARERDLSVTEIALFWRNVELLPASPPLRLAIKLALVTGQRINEVCGIAIKELTLDNAEPIWELPSGRTKNAKLHRVPLSALALVLINEALALRPCVADGSTSPWLFPARHKRDLRHAPMEGQAATVALFRGRAKIGIDDVRIHDLRRTAATRMAEMGVNPYTIGRILNHAGKQSVTEAHYMKYSFDAEKRAALNAWGNRLEEIVVEGQLRIGA